MGRPRPHGRYTRAEARGVDRLRQELAESGLASLVAFCNHAARSWSTLWDGIATWRISGEPFTEWAADELQSNLSGALDRVIGRRRPFDGPLDVTVTYRPDGQGVVLDGPQDDLDDYLSRVLVEAVHTGQAKHLKRCRQCGAFMLASCRRGELLSLQWQDVNPYRGEITIRAEHAKDRQLRRLPVSPHLKSVLDLIRLEPDGKPHKPDAYVFGDKIGRRVKDPKKAWAACRTASGVTDLHFHDLHFHDLRHEAGSRLPEAGWPLQHVRARRRRDDEHLPQHDPDAPARIDGLSPAQDRADVA